MTKLGGALARALVVAACLAACAEADAVHLIDDYEVMLDVSTNTLVVNAEPCGVMWVTAIETNTEVRLIVKASEDEECRRSSGPEVMLGRPVAGRSIVDDPTGNPVPVVVVEV